MRYANAKEIFPEDILKIIQDYADGEYIYIPKKDENRMAWGELTQSKKDIVTRNSRIYEDYLVGASIQNLSERYYLAPKTIQKIISQKRKYDDIKCAT